MSPETGATEQGFYLIPFLGENNLCAFFPSRFDVYSQDLVFDTGHASILVHDLLKIQKKSILIECECLDPSTNILLIVVELNEFHNEPQELRCQGEFTPGWVSQDNLIQD